MPAWEQYPSAFPSGAPRLVPGNTAAPQSWPLPPVFTIGHARPMGWECPKCGSVYAPGFPSCTHCGPKPAALFERSDTPSP